jgi:hypothetical protein
LRRNCSSVEPAGGLRTHPVVADGCQAGSLTYLGLAFLGNTVVWRGQRLRVLPGGKLVPLAPP